MAIVFGRIKITKPFEEWHEVFKSHAAARREIGVEDVMVAPVIGRQEVMYVVRTDHPRLVHDMSWGTQARAIIESSGHVLGAEEYIVCDEI